MTSRSNPSAVDLVGNVRGKKKQETFAVADLLDDTSDEKKTDSGLHTERQYLHNASSAPIPQNEALSGPVLYYPQRPPLRRFPSQTKDWTEQAAPEPFSSTPKPRQRKLGYGDYLKNDAGARSHETRLRYPNSHHGGKSSVHSSFFQQTDRGGIQTNHVGSQALHYQRALSSDEFPSLSPIKRPAEHGTRQSWSSIVGDSSLGAESSCDRSKVNNGHSPFKLIPPPPLINATPQISSEGSCLTNGLNDSLDSRKYSCKPEEMSMSQSLPKSFKGLHDQQTNNHRSDYSPFDTFTTMSRASLQNDIGTLLARSNRVQEALTRFVLSIDVAKQDLEGLKSSLQHMSSSPEAISQVSPNHHGKCPKVTEAEGLAWYRETLLKGGTAVAPPTTHFPLNYAHSPVSFSIQPRSASFSVESSSLIGETSFSDGNPIDNITPTQTSIKPSLPAPSTLSKGEFKRSSSHSNVLPHLNHLQPVAHDIVHDIHQHQKLDCPDEVYSSNGLTPLGLEYICDPLPVLGTALRKLVNQCLADDSSADVDACDNIRWGNSVHTRKRRMIAASLMDSAALIASRINLAGLHYRRAEDLEKVMSTLQEALDDCNSLTKTIDDPTSKNWFCYSGLDDVFGLLELIAQLNLGTALYKMNRVRDAMSRLELVKLKLEEMMGRDDVGDQSYVEVETSPFHLHNGGQHRNDDNRSPPFDYLLLVVRSSLSRISLRLNDHEKADQICSLIGEERKPQRRNSHTRSNSISGTNYALKTATAAYEHDLDRRFEWLHSVAEYYLAGMVQEAKGEPHHYNCAMGNYNRLLSLARVKLDHRHPYICSLLERRGAVLFEQRKLQCSMLSYLACLKILEHQKITNSSVFNAADFARILYAVARVLHDKEDYHDALYMYQRALMCQRALAKNSNKPSLDVITTLCNISRVHHLSGEIDAALHSNREVLELAAELVGGKMDHPFIIHRLKIEGNILIEAGRLEDAMNTFIDAARRCCEDGRNRMITAMMNASSGSGENSTQEDADAGDSSILSIRSAASLAHISFLHPAAPAG